MKSIANNFVALFDTGLSNKDTDSWLEQELLNYLDDRHQTVKMFRHKRLTCWIKDSPLISNLYYIFRLTFTYKSIIIIDGKLLPLLSVMVKIVKKITKHLIIIAGVSLNQNILSHKTKWNKWLITLGLKAGDFYFIDSEGIREWLVNNQIDHRRIILMKNTVYYGTSKTSFSWVRYHLQNKTNRKIRQRQFSEFFEQVG